MVLEIVISAIIALLVGLLVFVILRAEVKILRSQIDPKLREEVNNLKAALPRFEEVGLLKEQFEALSKNLTESFEAFKRTNAEEFSKVRQDIVNLAERRTLEIATEHIKNISICREEFDRLRERVERIMGVEELAERMELLASIFESTDLRVLTWQCKVIRLLEGGLAPDAEEDTMISAGVPLSSGKTFLKKLAEKDIVSLKKIYAYYLAPEYEWLYSYIDDPDWLKRRLEDRTKKEYEYGIYVRDNLSLIEDGLLVIGEQVEVPSGRIDLLCRDKEGIDVCIEFKYPATTTASVGQILKYREDYRRKTVSLKIRTMLICPSISTKIKELLQENQIEFREIPF